MFLQEDLMRRFIVVGKLILGLFLAALLLGSPEIAWASHNGPIFYVDDDNPDGDDTDGDYHFQSIAAIFAPDTFPKIGENDLIVVDPGRYTGDISINVKGIIIKGSEVHDPANVDELTRSRDLTKFFGQITITAKDVKVIGLDVDASGVDYAFLVQNDNVQLLGNKAHNGKESGIVVEMGSDEATLMYNEVFNNGTNGIHVRSDSDSAEVKENQVRSNGAIGVFVSESSDRALIANNGVSLNQSEGIKIEGSDMATVSNNEVANNALDGIRLEGASDGDINNNMVSSSGGYGVALVDSDNNIVKQNNVLNNDGGGIALRSGQSSSKRNIIEANNIKGNIRAGSEGILLEGEVSSNVLVNNEISNNSFGMRLKSTSLGDAPSNNTIDSNQIKDSPEDGIEVSGTAGRNRFVKNTLTGNNKSGVRLNNTTGNDEVLNNQIYTNGYQGVVAEGSPRNVISHNGIWDNGREGVSLVDSSDNNVSGNAITENRNDGVSITGFSENNDLENNQILNNRQNGVFVTSGVTKLDVRGNVIQSNVAHGMLINDANWVDVENNQIVANNSGGILVENGSNHDIEQNNIYDNVQFGLSVSGAPDLKADRNWWGNTRGPAGVFEGVGNAVLGMPNVFPWLTAPFEYLKLGSTSGEVIDDFGPADPATFLAMDKADTDVDFFKVGPDEDGMIINSKFYLEKLFEQGKSGVCQSKDSEEASPFPLVRELCVSELEGAFKAVSVLVSGLNSGTTLINVKYDESELGDMNPETLRLYYWEPTCDDTCSITGGHWVQLPGRSRTNVNIIEGEISVNILQQGRIIVVAPGGN